MDHPHPGGRSGPSEGRPRPAACARAGSSAPQIHLPRLSVNRVTFRSASIRRWSQRDLDLARLSPARAALPSVASSALHSARSDWRWSGVNAVAQVLAPLAAVRSFALMPDRQ